MYLFQNANSGEKTDDQNRINISIHFIVLVSLWASPTQTIISVFTDISK